MSFANPSKTDNLIYTMLPLTLSAWVVAVSWQSGMSLNYTETFAVAGFAVSWGSLFLYELGLDERIVKGICRSLAGSRTVFQKHAFLVWLMTLRTWETQTMDPPKEQDYIDKRVKDAAESVVSSFALERRLWRARATLYLLASMPFLFWTIGIGAKFAVDVIAPKINLVPVIGSILAYVAYQTAVALRDDWFLILIVIWTLEVAITGWRHRILIRHIQYAAQLLFATTFFSIDSMLRPGEYQERTEQIVFDVQTGRPKEHLREMKSESSGDGRVARTW